MNCFGDMRKCLSEMTSNVSLEESSPGAQHITNVTMTVLQPMAATGPGASTTSVYSPVFNFERGLVHCYR